MLRARAPGVLTVVHLVLLWRLRCLTISLPRSLCSPAIPTRILRIAGSSSRPVKPPVSPWTLHRVPRLLTLIRWSAAITAFRAIRRFCLLMKAVLRSTAWKLASTRPIRRRVSLPALWMWLPLLKSRPLRLRPMVRLLRLRIRSPKRLRTAPRAWARGIPSRLIASPLTMLTAVSMLIVPR